MTSTEQEFRPIGGPDRIDMLDAIRGVALFGYIYLIILVSNF